jgi:hypothetical protein
MDNGILFGMDFDKGIRATRVEVQYMQHGDKCEILDIHTVDEGAGMCFVMKSETGFSFNDRDEAMAVIDDFLARVGATSDMVIPNEEDDDDDE